MVAIDASNIDLTLVKLEFIIQDALFLGSSIRQSGRLLTARFQVRVLAEELNGKGPLRPTEPAGCFVFKAKTPRLA